MRELWKLAKVERGKGAPVLIPLFPYELGTIKYQHGKNTQIKLVPHRKQRLKIGEYVLVSDPSEWKQIGKNIYVSMIEIPDEKKLQKLLYEKEMIDKKTQLNNERTRALCYGLCGYMAKIIKKYDKKIPDSCFNQYWWSTVLSEMGIVYNAPLVSWNEKDFLKIYFLLKDWFKKEKSV